MLVLLLQGCPQVPADTVSKPDTTSEPAESAPNESPEPDCTPVEWHKDADGDGDGSRRPRDAVSACEAPEGYVEDDGDCDDTDARIGPSAVEDCDGVDNDCDDQVDEDCGIACPVRDSAQFLLDCAYVYDGCSDGNTYEVVCETQIIPIYGAWSQCTCFQNGIEGTMFYSFDVCTYGYWYQVDAEVRSSCGWDLWDYSYLY